MSFPFSSSFKSLALARFVRLGALAINPRTLGVAGALVGCLPSAGIMQAAETRTLHFSIPTGAAVRGLALYAQTSGRELLYSNRDLEGVVTNAVEGDFTADAALDKLLAGTDLVATRDPRSGAVAVARGARAENTGAGERRATTGVVSEVSGRVSNGATGAYLESAEVVLQPGGHQALTERSGTFRFSRVPAGHYTLTVSYAGLDPSTMPVDVGEAGETKVGDIAMRASIYEMSRYVVEGEREGNALAVQQQKTAANVRTVVSSDAFGNVADLNLGNFLQRLPGITPEISEGEIVRIQVRGTNANLSAINIDGTRAANGSTSTFNRAQDIDRLPADFIETIDVSKAITPEMDADSIGGAVNLRTKSPLDRKGRRTTYNAGYNYNVAQDVFRPQAAFSTSDQIRDGKMAYLVTASYNENYKPRDQNLLGWENTTDRSRPVFFFNRGQGIDQLRHMRGGVSGRFDYKFTDDTRAYVTVSYNNFRDQLNRRWVRLLEPTAANIVSVSPTVTEVRNISFDWLQTLRDRDVNTFAYTFGGESKLWDGKLDFTANYAHSRGTEQSINPTLRIGGTAWRQELVGSENGILMQQTGGPDIYNWNSGTIAPMDDLDTVQDDNILGAQLNFEKPFAISVPLVMKAGLRYRREYKSREREGVRYNTVATNFERFWEPGFRYQPASSGYPVYAGISPLHFLSYAAIRDGLDDPTAFRPDLVNTVRNSLSADNEITENVGAAYVQFSTRLGRLGILTGVRMENTRVDASGYLVEITPEEVARRAAWVGPVTDAETIRRTAAEYHWTTANRSYTNYFPSVHFKYNFTDNLIGRASYATGIARPNYSNIVPTYSINNDNDTISAPNPGLKPQFGRSYDLSLEYYFRPAGVVSVGLFEKRITDFIYRLNGAILGADNEFGPAYAGYTLNQDRNGGKAWVRGLEFNYQQTFQFLPGRWRGLGAFANGTWLRTEGQYNGPGASIGRADLTGFTPTSINGGLSYILYPWTIRAMVNYNSERLVAANASPARREIVFSAAPIDFKVAYALNRSVSLWCDVIDVFNEGRQDAYWGYPDRKSGVVKYSTVVKFGVSGSF